MRRIRRGMSLCMSVLLAVQLLVSPAFAVGESESTEDAVQLSGAEMQLMEGGRSSEGKTSSADETFSCSVEDCHGIVIPGYYSETEDAWYLFLTSTEDLSKIVVQYSGQITEASRGTLDQDNHCISGGFSASGDELVLTDAAGKEIRLIAMQSQLPSLQITLNGTTLEEIHRDKDVKYAGNSLLLTEPTGEYDLTAENSVEIKGRGNSTWQAYDKKPYQIKFNSKTSVLGMPKAKKWVLLANASDDSLMRTSLVYDLADQMDMPYVPSFEYVDLWIDGEYLGIYLLGEKVELGEGRLNLANPEGALFENDMLFYFGEDYWFYNSEIDSYFAVKESVDESEEAISAAISTFQDSLTEFALYLYNTPADEVTLADLNAMVDIESLAKYYLVSEYVSNREAYYTSCYWYQDGADDVLHMGPLWDYDTCMGNDGEPPEENHAHEYILFRYLLRCDAFLNLVQNLRTQYSLQLSELTTNTNLLYDEIIDSAKMNYLRWNVLGTKNPKGGYFHDTFEEAVQALSSWLKKRNESFEPDVEVESWINSDCTEMALYYYGGENLNGVKFAVWSIEGGQDDLGWYAANQNESGEWYAVADLHNHASSGIYEIHVYSTQPKAIIAQTKEYVKTAVEKKLPTLKTNISADNRSMELQVSNVVLDDPVLFAVWSEANGQDDLRWYPAERQADGSWLASVNLLEHQTVGEYRVHVYSGSGENAKCKYSFITQVNELPKPLPAVEGIVSDDCTVMDLALQYGDSSRQVLFAVWSEENGQDDLRWYPGELDENDVWRFEVDLAEHKTAGTYQIHVYYENNRAENMVAHTSAQVAFAVASGPSVDAVVSEDCAFMDVTLVNADSTEQMLFAVWSEENGQDDLHWYSAEWDSDGVWRYRVNLAAHQTAGTYLIHVYQGTNVPDRLIAHTTAEAAFVAQPAPEAKAVVSEDGSGIQLTVSHVESGAQLWIAVWSEENGQDDLHWYLVEQNADGVWNCSVSLSEYFSTGCYQIHVYDGGTLPEMFLTHTSIIVAALSDPAPAVVAAVSENGTMTLTLENAEAESQVWFAVWSEENGQDDLQWYSAEKNGTVWNYTADLENHSSYGSYLIHVYNGEGMPRELIAHTTVLYEAR